MSTMIEAPPSPEPDAAPARSKIVRRTAWSVVVLVGIALVFGGALLFSWMIDETHFDRPSDGFDALETQIASLPLVASVEKERWVEAPTFSDPTSWMSVTVASAGLPDVLEVACDNEYPDPVTWSFRVLTPASSEVTLNSTSFPAEAVGCPDFGFDAMRLVDQIDRVAPGIPVQPSIWQDGLLSLVMLEDQTATGYTDVLPLVEHADALVASAGLDAGSQVEINSMNLGLILEPGESGDYLALLTALAADHAVTSFWADGAGTPTDGIEKVQIIGPESEHRAIEELIRSSSLHIADLPVRFLEQ